MALSAKERERIIEEETLRYETRKNLHHQACASRPRRWPWIIAGILLVYFLYSRIFCGYSSCGMMGHRGMGMGKSCHSMMGDEGGVAPGQPISPEKAPKK